MVSYEEAIANLERAYLILDEASSRDKGISSNQTFRCCGAVHDMLTLLKEPEPVKPKWASGIKGSDALCGACWAWLFDHSWAYCPQ